MSMFLGQFGVTLRAALNAALERERELENEITVRRQTEAALQQSTERMETLHEIDRSLLAARSAREIALQSACTHSSIDPLSARQRIAVRSWEK